MRLGSPLLGAFSLSDGEGHSVTRMAQKAALNGGMPRTSHSSRDENCLFLQRRTNRQTINNPAKDK
jgi:hypothetical protein